MGELSGRGGGMIRSGGFCFVSVDDSLSVMNSAASCKAFYEKVSVSVPVPVEAFCAHRSPFGDQRSAFGACRSSFAVRQMTSGRRRRLVCQWRKDSLGVCDEVSLFLLHYP